MAKGRQRHKSEAQDPQAKHLTPRMQEAWKRFDGGDKLTARREAQAILANAPTEDEAQQARELLERLKLPRVALGLGAMAAVFILLLILLAVLRY